MNVCEQHVEQLQRQLEQLVETATTKLEQFCASVTTQVETVEQQWQESCQNVQTQVCQSWPWPLNVLCSWVTTLVCSLVLIAVTVWKPVVQTVCTFVTAVIKRDEDDPREREGRHYSCRASRGGSVVLVDEATEPVAAADLSHR